VPRADPASTNPNRVRDHLANERTFLAWLRTALAFVALGAALAGFGGSRPRDLAAAATTVAVGLVVLGYGTVRYYAVQRDIDAGSFRLARRAPLAVMVLVVAASAAVLALLAVSR
jgi:putative membrane protein